MAKYRITIQYYNGDLENIVLKAEENKLEWALEQYQRNRPFFRWYYTDEMEEAEKLQYQKDIKNGLYGETH